MDTKVEGWGGGGGGGCWSVVGGGGGKGGGGGGLRAWPLRKKNFFEDLKNNH